MAANFEAQVQAAKAYLLQTNADSKNNLYDHLSECLSKVLDERPNNSVDIFENISRAVKKEQYRTKPDTLQDQETPSERVELAEKQKGLFEKSSQDTDADAEEEVSIPFPDLMDVGQCFGSAGIGLGKEELFRINLALKQLTQKEPLVSARFWGKIYGTQANYIIAEAEYQEGEGEEEEGEEEEKEKEGGADEGEGNKDEEEDDDETKDAPLPVSQWKPPPVVPKEEAKTGANKKTYFVCNNAISGVDSTRGHCWTKLPHVTPAQIVAARQIRKLFTGRLDAPVVTFPLFPGNESNYLRAQIARISATTHISPGGYFQHPEDEEEEPDEESQGVIEPNAEFEITKASEFIDINNWNHHVSYLLPQGRTTWWNPVQKADDEFEEEEEEEDDEKEQPDEPEPESGPPLLTSVAEDEKVNGLPSWTTKLSSSFLPQYAVAIASSNLWPGAHSYAAGKKFENVYIGWGLKYNSRPFNPVLPPPVQEEFPPGADITETTDPTVEQEAALKAAREEAEAQMEEEEEPEESDED